MLPVLFLSPCGVLPFLTQTLPGTPMATARLGRALRRGRWSWLKPAVSSTGQPQPLFTEEPPAALWQTLGTRTRYVSSFKFFYHFSTESCPKHFKDGKSRSKKACFSIRLFSPIHCVCGITSSQGPALDISKLRQWLFPTHHTVRPLVATRALGGGKDFLSWLCCESHWTLKLTKNFLKLLLA